MKTSWEDEYEMPAEMDFTKLRRIPNPWTQNFRDLNLVSLDDDVASEFPDSEAVNAALREVIKRRNGRIEEETLAKAS